MSEPTYGDELPVSLAAQASHYAGFQAPANDGSVVELVASRDGSLRTFLHRDALVLAGRVFVVNYGQASTVITGTTSFTARQPTTNLDIPAGTVVIPLWMNVAVLAMTGTANDIILQSTTNLIGAGTSSAATVGPVNANQGSAILSACTARQAYSANGAAPTGPLELWSVTDPTAATGSVPTTFQYLPAAYLPLYGPASLDLYAVSTTTALTLKAVLVYAELNNAYL